MRIIPASSFLLAASFCGFFGGTPLYAKEVRWDVEIDPIAYAFDGFSLHVGASPSFGRLDLGVFGMKLPKAVLGNRNFEASFRGTGFKWDFSPGYESGLFFGVDGGWSEQRFKHLPTQEKTTRYTYGYGGRVGYRFIASSWTVTPWFGLSYEPKAENVRLGGEELKQSKIQPFPTIHVGHLF